MHLNLNEPIASIHLVDNMQATENINVRLLRWHAQSSKDLSMFYQIAILYVLTTMKCLQISFQYYRAWAAHLYV